VVVEGDRVRSVLFITAAPAPSLAELPSLSDLVVALTL
jgi:hypothetical protein